MLCNRSVLRHCAYPDVARSQVRMRGEAAAAAKRELEAGRAALARGRDDLLQSQRDLAQAQACPCI